MADESESKPNTDKPELTEQQKIDNYYEQYLEDLNSNKYENFFADYNAGSVERFKKDYAEQKAHLKVKGQYYVDEMEHGVSGYSDLALEKLMEIQQRKLFDMQCRWRAEEIDIPGIYVSYDFTYWSKNIGNCPFLTPISSEEFERYVAFVKSARYDDVFDYDYGLDSWQEYDDFKKYYQGDDSFTNPPGWYQFYENKTGLSSLYLLPDIRGEKEQKYIQTAYAKKRKEHEEKNKSKPTPNKVNKPYIWFHDNDELEKFLNEFETEQTKYLFRCYRNWKSVIIDDDLELAIETLKRADREIFINSARAWRESIIDTANEYVLTRITEALPNVYNNYLVRVNSGIAFEETKDFTDYEKFKNHFEELILEGRELLGEPRDFNF